MALIDITPNMTSNNSPSPFVISSNGYQTGFDPFKSFSIGSGYWWSNSSSDAFLMLDMGESRLCSNISINRSLGQPTFKTSELVGSNNGLDFETIMTIDFPDDFIGIINYEIGKVVNYRYYKFKILDGDPVIGKIKLYINESFFNVTAKCTHGIASSGYTLPMSSTTKILAKQNDSREGLLGMANDPNNYGDLYVVGKDGRSHLTKSGIKSEVIWEGSLDLGQGATNLLLSNIDVSKYKQVTLEFGITEPTYGTLATHQTTINAPSMNNPMYTSSVSSGAHYFVTHFIFKESKEIQFIETYKSGWNGNSVLTKIIGIY